MAIHYFCDRIKVSSLHLKKIHQESAMASALNIGYP